MMNLFLLANTEPNDLWYALPLIVVVSLVYAATRHERTSLILRHAVHTAAGLVAFMAVVFVVLWLLDRWA